MEMHSAGIHRTIHHMPPHRAGNGDTAGQAADPAESFQHGTEHGRELLPAALTGHPEGSSAMSANLPAARSESEKEAFALILNSSGSDREAFEGFKWLKEHMPPGANLEDMAEFYVLGNEIYDAGNPDRESLIERSLKGINDYLNNNSRFMGRLTVGDKKEIFRILLKAIPPRQNWVMSNVDTLRPLEFIHEQLNNKAVGASRFEWGGSHLIATISPPPGADISMVEATREYASFLEIITHSKGRKNGEVRPDDDSAALQALQIMRNTFHYDGARTEKYKTLMAVTGDPWDALGIMHRLDEVEPSHRAEAEKRVLKNISAMREEAVYLTSANIAECTDRVYLIYSLMQPQESPGSMKAQVQRVAQGLADSYPPAGNVWSFEDSCTLQQRVMMIGKNREPGESIMSSARHYKTFVDRMMKKGLTLDGADILYGLGGRERQKCLDAVPGAHTFNDIYQHFGELADESRLPPSLIPAMMETALKMRAPGESLHRAFERLTVAYQSMGDMEGMADLRPKLNQVVYDGFFPGMTSDQLMPEIENYVKMGILQGRSVDDAFKKAINETRWAHMPMGTKREIRKNDGVLEISGIKVRIDRGSE